MILPFTKMQAVGNDFIVVESSKYPADTDWPALTIRLCDHKFGIGSDGLLVVAPSDVADTRMLMFNPDGSEDMCGNGLRCVVEYAHAHGIVGAKGTVECFSGVRSFTMGEGNVITTEMGAPKFSPSDIPARFPTDALDQTLEIDGVQIPVQAVSTGSTHCVVWRDKLPGNDEFFALSPRIENHPMFPDRTNVMWASQQSPDCITVRIYERGAGATLACGTGACAVAAVARRSGRSTAPQIHVQSPGGILTVNWTGQAADSLFLTGTAHTVFTGEIEV